MDPSFLLTIAALVIGFFVIFRKYRSSHQQNEDLDSSSSSSPSSSSLSHNWTHDVFPSFRGEDVRRDFLSHVLKEFQRKGITPFIDNEIRRGESIGPELKSAIRGSKIAIVLLSKNYASSKWCLDELVEIMKCREESGQIVLAIFYKVDPSQVKKLTGDFGKVFRKTCAGKSKEHVKRWSQALEKVATIAGYHSINWDNEAAMIEKIATDVSKELIVSTPSSNFDRFVGMRGHMGEMEQLLCLESDDVRMIGIWGPSGIGKSTIARVLFDEYSCKFQLSVFMANIKRRYPISYHDTYSAQLQLQTEMLSKAISQYDIKVHHLDVVKDRLKDKKVLIVLDDVDHLMQLDAVAKEAGWFGPGSRIIISTQDIRVLQRHGIIQIHEVGFPSDSKALKIFCMYAFGQKSPFYGFESLAREVTRLAGNLPLGLRVMGSYLRRMSKDEWMMELPKMQTSLDGEIESVLKFSYNALCDEDKKLFIYIAWFFKSASVERLEAFLANHFSNVRHSLHVLAEKSLISLCRFEGLSMHDLLVRFGREISRKQAYHDPRQRQFLVDDRKSCQLLGTNYTQDNRNVIGIDFKYCENVDVCCNCDKVFENIGNLQFVRLQNSIIHPRAYLPKCLEHLLQNIRLLSWEYFPLTCLPSNLNTEFLVEIYMPHSKLEKLWQGVQRITNLKWMDLSFSKNLKEVPDLSLATNLKTMKLHDCSSLVKLPSSLGNLRKLEKLHLKGLSSLEKLYLGCFSSLVELPSSIGNATSLETLDLSGCSSLVELPSSIGNATSLQTLDLGGCSSLVELPSSIGNITSLETLDLSGCSSLVELPSSIGNATSLERLNLSGCSSLVELPSSIGNATSLKWLNLGGCSSLVELPSSIGNATSLETLDLSGCSSLVELPSSIGNATSLQTLDLRGCSSLVELPSSIGNATNLWTLDLSHCSCLVELPSSIGNATNLWTLDLSHCSCLVELPSSIGNATNLWTLDLSHCSCLVELPSSIGNATNLWTLDLSGCSSLVELPSSIGNATGLQKLNLSGCSSLVELPSSIGNATSLKKLNLSGCSSLVELPYSIGNATSLETLDLSGCSSLVELPSSIGNATSLQTLDLGGCSSLVELPSSIGNATSLEWLNLDGCSSLVELPSSIGNATSLKWLYLSGCSSLVELPSSIGNATNLWTLDLSGCSRLVELPSSIGNATSLETLYLSGCSSLVELPSSIGNATSLELLDLKDCSSLVELPSSIGNATSLKWLNLSGCSSLVELPSSIGNVINLENLYLNGCTSMVELPSSIGNLHKLQGLYMKGCSKLKSLPVNINMESLDELHLTDCSLLKTFPEISTNISSLKLDGTAIEEIPSSIRSWSRLREFAMTYSENLGNYPHALGLITELHVGDKRVRELAPWINEMSRLSNLSITGCKELTSLPPFRVSLQTINAENCFKLNQEARDLIVRTSDVALLPGVKVPTNFLWRATGSSLSMKWNGNDTHQGTSLVKFKACLLLLPVYKDDIEVGGMKWFSISCKSINFRSFEVVYNSPLLCEHLVTFEMQEMMSCGELVLEFEVDDQKLKIIECGLNLVQEL